MTLCYIKAFSFANAPIEQPLLKTEKSLLSLDFCLPEINCFAL